MNDDFERIYSVADSATLVGLEPILQLRIDWAKERLTRFDPSSHALAEADQSAGLAEMRAETLMALGQREDCTDDQRSEIRELLDRLIAKDSELASSMAKTNEENYSATFAYLTDLVQRRRAIFAVLVNRNLLPEPPG